MNSLSSSKGYDILHVYRRLQNSSLKNDAFPTGSEVVDVSVDDFSVELVYPEIRKHLIPRDQFRLGLLLTQSLPKLKIILLEFTRPLSKSDIKFVADLKHSLSLHEGNIKAPLVVLSPSPRPFEGPQNERVGGEKKVSGSVVEEDVSHLVRQCSDETGVFFFTITGSDKKSTDFDGKSVVGLLNTGADLEKEVVDIRFEGRALQYVVAVIVAPALIAIIGKLFEKSADVLHGIIKDWSFLICAVCVSFVAFFCGWVASYFLRVDLTAYQLKGKNIQAILSLSVVFSVVWLVLILFIFWLGSTMAT
jgi:hypothetical protein